MNIIERFSISKSGHLHDNEDRIVIAEHFCAVIDGMTPKDSNLYLGVSSAQIAVDLITVELCGFQADITCSEAVSKLTRRLQNYYVERQILAEVASHPFKRLGASLIVYSKLRKEIWMVGDCQALVDGVHVTNEKLIDHLIAEIRSKLIERYLNRYSLDDLLEYDHSRADIHPFLIQQFEFQNNRYESSLSYSVLDGFPISEGRIKRLEVPDAKFIVLASDGYPILKENHEETEACLNAILQSDPLCYQTYRSTKGLKKGNVSFDDRSFLKIALQEI